MKRYTKKPVTIEASQWFTEGDHDGVGSSEALWVNYIRVSQTCSR